MDKVPCQVLFKYFRFLMMNAGATLLSPNAVDIVRTYEKMAIETFRRRVSRYCIDYFRKHVNLYIENIGDRKRAWTLFNEGLAHRIDYEYRKYGITEANWTDYLSLQRGDFLSSGI